MRLLAIGDVHGDLEKVKHLDYSNVDYIILTGDFGKTDKLRKIFLDANKRKSEGKNPKRVSSFQRKRAHKETLTTSLKVLKFLSTKAPILAVYGNADFRMNELTDSILEKKLLKLLREERISFIRKRKIGNYTIGGLDFFLEDSWVSEFEPTNVKAILYAKGETKKVSDKLKKIKKVDIVLSHIPPFGTLDLVQNPHAPNSWNGKHAGSKLLLDYIKKHKPHYVICGHIHEGEGQAKIGNTEVINLGEGAHTYIELP